MAKHNPNHPVNPLPPKRNLPPGVPPGTATYKPDYSQFTRPDHPKAPKR